MSCSDSRIVGQGGAAQLSLKVVLEEEGGGGGDVSSDAATHSSTVFPFFFPSSLYAEQLVHLSLQLHCSTYCGLLCESL